MLTLPASTATPADLPTLLEMAAESHALERIPWEPERVRNGLSRLLGASALGQVVMLREQGVVRGYFILTFSFDLEWGREVFLTELFIRAEARGRRLGTAAIEIVEAEARRLGAGAVHLMVRPENEPALRLYRRAGFETPPRLFMTKPL